MTAVIIFYLIDPLLVKFKSEFKFEIPAIILAIFKPVLLLAGTVAFKIVIGKILNIRDDVSIVEASHCFLKILFLFAFNVKNAFLRIFFIFDFYRHI